MSLFVVLDNLAPAVISAVIDNKFSFLSLMQDGSVLGRYFCLGFCQAILQLPSGCSGVTLLSTRWNAVLPWLVVWLIDKIMSSYANSFSFHNLIMDLLVASFGSPSADFRGHILKSLPENSITLMDFRLL